MGLCRGFSDGFDIVSSYSVARSEFLLNSLKAFAERSRAQRMAKQLNDNGFQFLVTSQKSKIPAVPKYHVKRSSRLTRAVAVNPSLQMEAVGLDYLLPSGSQPG